MRSFLFAFVLLVGGAPLAHATPPSAPLVTVGANDIEQLQFDITPVTRVNWYELWFRANPGATWVKYGETRAQRPLFRVRVSVHLLDWRVARYQVKACNPSGCSASAELGVDGLALDAMGYIKPAAAGNNHFFGHTVTLSADGKTMAVLSGETIAAGPDSLVVHVYRRTTSTSGWRREARLRPPDPRPFTSLSAGGTPVALSGDGNTLVLGVATAPNGGTISPPQNGAAFLWRFENATWRLAQTFTGAPVDRDWYGFSVEIDDAAQTLAIWHQYSASGQLAGGSVDVYRWRDAPVSAYERVHDVTVPAAAGTNGYCAGISLSGDGRRLFRTCSLNFANVLQVIDVSSDLAWTETARLTNADNFVGVDSTFDGKRFIATNESGASVFDETPAGWVRGPALDHGTTFLVYNHNDGAISRDGKIVALGNRDSSIAGLGPVYPPYESGGSGTGSVYVYEHKLAGWSLRRIVKPGSSNYQWAGHSVALGDNGRVLAVGAPYDPSAATGIDGDRADSSEPERGAVWLY